MNNNKIVEIATNVFDKYDIYVVNGKPIAIKNHAFDMSDSYDIQRLFNLSDDLFDKDKLLPAIYGADTMAVVISMGDEEYTVSMTCISGFPDFVKSKIRSVVSECSSV